MHSNTTAPTRRRTLQPEDVLAIVARVRLGEWRYAIAKDFGISESAICRIMTGSRHSDITGIRPRGEKAPNERHASVLLQQIAQKPERAPVLSAIFDQRFGAGAAVKTVKRVMTAGAG